MREAQGGSDPTELGGRALIPCQWLRQVEGADLKPLALDPLSWSFWAPNGITVLRTKGCASIYILAADSAAVLLDAFPLPKPSAQSV